MFIDKIIQRCCVAVFCAMLIAAGCSSTPPVETDKPDASSVPPDAPSVPPNNAEPVTLNMYQNSALISDDDFQSLIAEPVKQKYPNVTMQLITRKGDINIQGLVAANDFPEMVLAPFARIVDFTDLDLAQDLNGFIQQHQFDVGKFSPEVIESIRKYGADGELYALPFNLNFAALFYNKDLFDKFGVEYPEDGMYWEDAISLARNLARVEGGIQYYSLYPGLVTQMGSLLSLPYVDQATGKASLQMDGWKNVFTLYQDIFKLPGSNEMNRNRALPEHFMSSRNLAMYGGYGAILGQFEEIHQKGEIYNWDMVSYPNFKEAPKTGFVLDSHTLLISKTGKHQETAFQVIELLTSEEVQLQVVRKGKKSALTSTALEDSFGSELASLEGKNIQAVFYNRPAVPAPFSIHYNRIRSLAEPVATKLVAGQIDVNTALREWEEASNQAIAAAEGK